MSVNDFTHLHLHTQYSFLDGAIRIKDLVKRIAELGMKQVAVTDHGNMFGALDFYQQAKKGGIKPILGIEAYITGKAKHTDKIRENFHLVLLAENNTGYDNLRKLTSKAFVDGKYYFPRIDKELLYQHREGIIASTACLGGEVGKKCAQGDLDGAREAVREFKSILGPNNFFLEVQPNGVPIQQKVNADLAQIAKDEGLRINATNDCHYVTQDQHDAQNILMAIRQQKSWDDPTLHKHESDAFYIRSGQEMWDHLKDDYAEGFETACEIGKRCNVELQLGKTFFPPFPCPDNYKDEADYLRHLSLLGLKRRFDEISYPVDREEYSQRLEHEIKVIIGMGFSSYFLIVQDFINWAKNSRIRVGPGRGSGAGSLVAYALRITDIDPIPYHLLFERFLNPERVSLPDFDVDFMQERRGEVIQYVAQKYGRDHVGQIATYSALNPKSAIKDVARTLGVPFAEINELTKPMPILVDGKKPDMDQSLDYAPKLREKAQTDDVYRRVLQNARVLEGLYRQAGMHAGGVVIGQRPLVDYVPVFAGANGELVTQFDKDKVEDAGLIKFDFLGLKTLDVISHAEDLVNFRIEQENKLSDADLLKALKKHPHAKQAPKSPSPLEDERLTVKGGLANHDGQIFLSPPQIPYPLRQKIPPLNIDLLAPTNEDVFKLLGSGDTLGVFQVESSGFQELCRKLKPDCFEDIIAAVALYRPGPMQSGMVDDFIDRKHKRKKLTYPHPLLETVLKPTYGTFVYQEQVLQAAQVLAGYTLGTADLLRRAMGKKKFEEMEKERGKFVSGAEKNGVASENAEQIFDSIEKFAGYGFNKSHAAAYALITYQTGYLKRFYPVEFLAALLTTSSGSTEDVVKYVHEARTHGIKVLSPDINLSECDFTVEYEKDTPSNIRFGLGAVKGIGDSAVDAMLQTRIAGFKWKNLLHFCETVTGGKANKKLLDALIKSGAMDGFARPRKQLASHIEKAIARAQNGRRDQKSGQTSMFGLFQTNDETSDDLVYENVQEWPQKEKLKYEREALGFYLSGHPLDRYTEEAKRLGAIPTINLTSARHFESVQIVGVVAELKERPLKSGKGRWAVVIIEDNFGQAEVLCFSKSYDDAEQLLKSGEPLLVRGRAIIDDIDDEGRQMVPKLRLESVASLNLAQIESSNSLEILVKWTGHGISEALLSSISESLQKSMGEKRVSLVLEREDKTSVTLSCGNLRVNPSEELISQLEGMDSSISVRLV